MWRRRGLLGGAGSFRYLTRNPSATNPVLPINPLTCVLRSLTHAVQTLIGIALS